MTRITGNEPEHWHDADGKHAMNDPRRAFGDKWRIKTGDWTSADERAYVEHLIQHEEDVAATRRQPGDSDEVSALFDMADNLQHQLTTLRHLISALRERDRNSTDSKET